MIRRIDPVAKSMALNRRRTATRVVQDKRDNEKKKRDDKEIRDAKQQQLRQDKDA